MMSIAPRSTPTGKCLPTLLLPPPPSDEKAFLMEEINRNVQQPQSQHAPSRESMVMVPTSPRQVVTTEFLDITGMSGEHTIPISSSTTTSRRGLQPKVQKRLSQGSGGSGGGGLCRTKTLLSFTDASSSSSTTTSSQSLDTLQGSWEMSEKDAADLFGCETRSLAKEGPAFNKTMREAMEPHLQQARLHRERMRHRNDGIEAHDSIASSVGVPYTDLRKERRFLFDEYTHPLHTILADTLGVEDLSRIHELNVSDQRLLEPLLMRHKRLHFQECYDSFVTTFCIPLLHSLAMKEQLFHSLSSTTRGSSKINYRYQAFPCIRILRPGDCHMAPHCDVSLGHSVGYLGFHIPITPAFGTNALFAESHPGREDWHPFTAKAFGLGYLFDGARCLHFTFENTTPATSVWLDFRIAIYNDHTIYNPWDGSGLCTRGMLDDMFTRSGPGYYDEAVIDLAASSQPAFQISAVAAKKRGAGLLDPDGRVGVPFCG